MQCPKCGFGAGSLSECPRCGIVFAKYAARRGAGIEPPVTGPPQALPSAVSVTALTEPPHGPPRAVRRYRAVGLRRKAHLYRQLATLQRSGVALTESLLGIADHERSASAKSALRDIRERVLGGALLREATAAHPYLFDRSDLALLAAAEESGKIAEAWDALATGAELRLSIRRDLVSALFYPAIILILGCFLLPLRVLILEGTGAYLAAAIIPLALSAGVVTAIWGGRGLVRRFYPALGSLGSWIPILGPLLRQLAIARAAGTLGQLLGAGLPVHTSLRESGAASGNRAVARTFVGAAQRVSKGSTLADALGEAGLQAPLFLQVVRSAERAGTLGSSLIGFSEAELATAVHRLKLFVRAMAILLTLSIFGYLAWRTFAQATEVRESIEKTIDSITDGDVGDGVRKLLDKFQELEKELR